MIVIGSSLKVRPVALIPSFLKPGIPQILINREQLPHMQFDVELYGNCDDVINELCCQLGEEWSHITESFVPNPLNNEKYKSFLGINNASDQKTDTMKTNGYSSCDNDHNIPVITNGISADVIQAHSYILENAGYNKQSRRTNDNDNSKKSQNYSENSEILEDKKSTYSNSIIYSFLPPNCYIFHGAEMECQPESEDDMNDGDHHCCSNEDSICSWNMPVSNHTSIEMVIPSTSSIEKVPVISIEKGSVTTRNTSLEELPTTNQMEKDVVSIGSTSVNVSVLGENIQQC